MKSNPLWNNLIRRRLGKKLNFINLSEIKNVLPEVKDKQKPFFFLFLDNIIGTGNQFKKKFRESLKIDINKLIEIKRQNTNTFFKIVAEVGSTWSKINIMEEIELFDYDDFEYVKTIREEDKAFYPENWNNKDMLEELEDFLKEKHPKKNYRGYGNCEYLVITEISKPNNTIPCLIYSNDEWNSFFERMHY